MQITLDLNDELVQAARELNPGMKIEVAIETALKTYIEQQKRLKVIELFGTIDYDPDYDYKKQRTVR